MSAANWALAAHVVIFAVWFGTDLATFTISRRVVDPAVATPARLALASAMMSIEIFARLCLPLTLGTGIFVAQRVGWVTWSSWVGVVALAAAVCWVGLVWSIHRTGNQGLGSRLTTADLVIRVCVGVAVWVVALSSLVTDDGLIVPKWLGVKAALFATIMTCGIAIRFALRPFGAAFGALVADGSTPERERQLQGSIRRAQPFVGVIWACLVIAAVLGVAKPDL